jgi:undecaprenyl diphosphate synthase
MFFSQENSLDHIGIIMDGNGRWAKAKNLSRSKGHEEGLRNIKNICESAIKYKIKFLTLFSLSSENLFRPEEEIYFLINLVDHAINFYQDFLFENHIIFNFFGDLSILKDEVIEKIQYIQNKTKENFSASNSITLNIAFNYGGRQEIIFAANQILKKFFKNIIDNKLDISKIKDFQINENELEKNFYLQDIPPPDLIIRTGSYQRMSNFLLWQSAYSELYFSEKLWPDFDNHDFLETINFFHKQKRNFGLICENSNN